MIIRELNLDDGAIYQDLMRGALREHAESFRISEQDAGEPIIPFAEGAAGTFTLGVWLAHDGAPDGRLVGVVSFAREVRVKHRHKGLLYRMYVHSEAAGRGIGSKLVEETVRRARALAGLEQITLTVVATNSRAKRLYSSLGFERFALEKRGLKVGDRYYDEEQMALYLSAQPHHQDAATDALQGPGDPG